MQKRHLLVFVLAAAAIAVIVWWRWPRSEPRQPAAQQGSAAPLSHEPERGAPAGEQRGGAASRVRRLEPGDRLELYGKIQAAIARARQAARDAIERGSSAPGSDDVTIPLEQVSAPLQDALREAIPLLAECFPKTTGKTAAALMKMATDPELGTVIDTETIADADGKPLDPKVDECLRDTIDSLALPGLGQRGMLELQYTFRF